MESGAMERQERHPAARWLGQAARVAEQELRRTLLSRRILLVLLLALSPVALAALRAVVLAAESRADIGRSILHHSEMFRYFVLRFVVFFGLAGIFVNLFRGEFTDRTLHHALLAPLRREVLALGKYLQSS